MGRIYGTDTYPSKSDCIEAILRSQPQKVEILPSATTVLEEAGLSVVDCHNGVYLINKSTDNRITLKVCYVEAEYAIFDYQRAVQILPSYEELYRGESIDTNESLKDVFQWVIQYFSTPEPSPSHTKVETESPSFTPEDCTITPVAKTDVQTAYNVRSNGLLIGLIFHVRNTSWQCGDGKHYGNPVDAIAALQKITSDEPRLVMISDPRGGFGKYQTPDGEIEVRQQGELSPREKLWKNNLDEFYYSTHLDALKQVNPVAVQARDLSVGDKVLLSDGFKTIKNIRDKMFHGLRGLELVLDGCDSITTIWFNPVRIA
jgi:hypothetical protein